MQPPPNPTLRCHGSWSARSRPLRAQTPSLTSKSGNAPLGRAASRLHPRLGRRRLDPERGVPRRGTEAGLLRQATDSAFAFRLHDHDGDGALDLLDLIRVITLALAEDDVNTRDRYVQRRVAALRAAADANGDGRISFEAFEIALDRRPRLLEQRTRNLLVRLEHASGGNPQPLRLGAGWGPAAFRGVSSPANRSAVSLTRERTR
jgi:hypothetical protein